jgi:hypothetical protein
MKRSVVVLVAAVLALSGVRASAQGPESFMGIVKAVSNNSVTVEHGTITGVFAVDAKTHVSAKGSTAKTKENIAAGKPGLTVPDIIHVGDQVMVKYSYVEKSNTMLVSDIAVRESLSTRK